MINKKGLSDVITTVLIILLAIAAISIVWSFVSPTLKDAGEKLSADCIQLEIEPTACVIDSTTEIANVTYQWKAGGGLDSVKVSISDGTNSIVAKGDKPSSVLATTSKTGINVTSLDNTADRKASVIAVTKTTSGKEQTCSAERAVEIVCTTA